MNATILCVVMINFIQFIVLLIKIVSIRVCECVSCLHVKCKKVFFRGITFYSVITCVISIKK